MLPQSLFPHLMSPVSNDILAGRLSLGSSSAATRRSCSALVKIAGHAPFPITSPRWRLMPAWWAPVKTCFTVVDDHPDVAFCDVATPRAFHSRAMLVSDAPPRASVAASRSSSASARSML